MEIKCMSKQDYLVTPVEPAYKTSDKPKEKPAQERPQNKKNLGEIIDIKI